MVVLEDEVFRKNEVFLNLNYSLPRLKELKALPESKNPEVNPGNE